MAQLEAEGFSLDAVARSGQVFTWRQLDEGRWLVASGARRCVLSQEEDALEVSRVSGGEPDEDELSYWRHYLALDEDYDVILDGLELPDGAREANLGLRVLSQDWWDVAISFVVSQNSNIPRIQRTVWALMDAGDGCVPSPGGLLELFGREGFVEGLKLGYRRPYLEALAERALEWRPSCLERSGVSLDETMAELEETPGIGPKVASCICLFGLGYLNAVPRDTWIKRAERETGMSWDERYGGIQQQYVFAWYREGAGRRERDA